MLPLRGWLAGELRPQQVPANAPQRLLPVRRAGGEAAPGAPENWLPRPSAPVTEAPQSALLEPESGRQRLRAPGRLDAGGESGGRAQRGHSAALGRGVPGSSFTPDAFPFPRPPPRRAVGRKARRG